MSAPDLEVIKDIPGYKVILKAVLKSQIQQLVEQLAAHTDEESVILTASVSDGSLSHLGSDSGKSFLQDHEDVKSQFLGFCLKKHHRKKQEEDRLEALRNMPPAQTYNARPQFPTARSPRQVLSPPARSRGSRYEPYPVECIRAARPPVSVQTVTPDLSGPGSATQRPIKIEPLRDTEDESIANPTDSDKVNSGSNPSTSHDNSQHIPDRDSFNDSALDPSDSVSQDGIHGEPGEHSQSIKVEAISESDMELEITGVEPGISADQLESAESWGADISGNMGYDSSGATGSSADLQQGYTSYQNEQHQRQPVVVKTEKESYERQYDEHSHIVVKVEKDNTEPPTYGVRSLNKDPTQNILKTSEIELPQTRFMSANRSLAEIALKGFKKKRISSITRTTNKQNIWATNMFAKWRQFVLKEEEEATHELVLVKAILSQASLLSMTVEELNIVLPVFFTSVKRDNGEEYKDESMSKIAWALQRYFQMNGRPINIFQDDRLAKIRNTIEAMMQEKCKQDKHIKKPDKITKEQELSLWQMGYLGTTNPRALLDTMFWTVVVYFGLRDVEEHSHLTFENFSVEVDSPYHRYLCFTKSVNTDFEGGVPQSSKSLIHENVVDPYKCPVRIFLEYQSKIPDNLRKTGFYFHPVTNLPIDNKSWFSHQPLDHNSLIHIIRDLMTRARLKGSYTIHSVKSLVA